jgi:hypothetical protein
MIAKVGISARYFYAACLGTGSQPFVIGPTSTARLYLGVQTQWYLLE